MMSANAWSDIAGLELADFESGKKRNCGQEITDLLGSEKTSGTIDFTRWKSLYAQRGQVLRGFKIYVHNTDSTDPLTGFDVEARTALGDATTKWHSILVNFIDHAPAGVETLAAATACLLIWNPASAVPDQIQIQATGAAAPNQVDLEFVVEVG